MQLIWKAVTPVQCVKENNIQYKEGTKEKKLTSQ